MWTHATVAAPSKRDGLDRRGIGALLDSWWQLPASTADGGALLPREREVPIAASPARASELTLLRVEPPADVLGTQVDGFFELPDGTAVRHRTRRFAPKRAQRKVGRRDAIDVVQPPPLRSV